MDFNFIRSLENAKPGRGWQRSSTEQIFSDWLDRSDIRDNGLEQAIIKRVSQFEFLNNFHSTRTRGKSTNSDYLNHLSHLVCAYLKQCKSNSSGQTKKFVNSVFPIGTPLDQYLNRIVTFNYDTLIDRQLLDRGISRRKLYFDRIVKNKGDGVRRNIDEKFDHPLILKLHGSINWRCDRKHFDDLISGAVSQEEKLEIWHDDDSVPKPHDGQSPLIIPPIPNKPITASSLFNFLWTCAYEYMHEAKKIVIVGYSCPPTDTLASTMFGHFNSKNLEEIYVVDPNAIALKNYREMLDPKVASGAKWRYYSSFSEYIEGEIS
ncbi:hypothetical protein [Marinobacterium aestuariivivens]|uniref:SIR2-like domain-containing protein n=1 Tax=Marinobacterium aestuariivivens TaxID=1698799 RepID=A0ABW2A4B0_9GAMM